MKKCFKCGEDKHRDDFYKHPMMADGLLGKCKACTKSDVRTNRADKIEYYRMYDRERGCRLTQKYLNEYRQRFPRKIAAQRKVAYEVSKGTLTAKPCAKCGEEKKTHAHHADYSKKLDIQWLCAACHSQWHVENGEGLNAA